MCITTGVFEMLPQNALERAKWRSDPGIWGHCDPNVASNTKPAVNMAQHKMQRYNGGYPSLHGFLIIY